MTEERELEVTIISAQDLKNVTTFGKQSPYAVVWIDPPRKTSTPVATHGGVNPSWNAVVKVLCEQRLIDQGNGVMTIEIHNQGSISSKQIGSVIVPLSQAIARDDKPSNQPKYMSFQVRKPSGQTQGVLNISVKLGNLVTAEVVTSHARPTTTTAYPTPVAAYKQQPTSNLQYQYPPPPPQYPPQYGAQAQYPPPQYYAPPPPPPPPPRAYYPQAPVTYVQQVQRPSGSRFGGGSGLGLGAGLLGGAVGGLVLGEILDGGGGGGGCGGGGCGGGGCGGGGCGGG